MSTRFSENQIKAIKLDGNVIVSAGAGSGKTTVMIERIIDKLRGGAELEQMLIVTFTRASAADIKVKLARRLSELKAAASGAGDTDTLRKARRAAEALPVCNIGTLHSFCQRLIRAYAGTAELDPACTVADESDARALKRAAIRAAVDGAWKSGDGDFRAVYDALSSRRNDDGVVDTVENIVEFALSLPDPDGYLSATVGDGARHAELDAILAARKSALSARAVALRGEIERAGFTLLERVVCETDDYLDGRIDGFTVTRFNKNKYGDDCAEINERFKKLKDDCKKFRELQADAATAKTLDSAPYARALCAVARDALDIYARRKREHGKLDYSDLEHGALKVLADPDCAREIGETVKYVFIDEYQDVNSLQAEISNRLERGGAQMFLIGDVKQSIYGFRRCDPKYFREKIAAASRGEVEYTHIRLTDNYRSSREVIDFVNGVFDGVMSESFGGADYASERLSCGSGAAGGDAGLYRIPADPAEFDDEAESDGGVDGALQTLSDASAPVYSVVRAADAPTKPDIETEFIAERILRYADGARARGDGSGFGSVAVLLRSARSGFCTRLARTFDRYGIKYDFGRKASVGDYAHAAALLDILRIVDNRFDDVALYTALRSPMGGFSDAELLEIARTGESAARRRNVKPARGGSVPAYTFWQKATAYDGALKDRVKAFYALRDEFAEYAKSHDCADVLGYITSSIDYFQHVYESNGQAQAVEALIAYAEERRCDVHSFLASGSFELGFAGRGDAVTVTTVHSSKGLEYDFVIVADCAHRFRLDDTYSKAIVSDAGVAVKFPDVARRKLVKSVPWLIENATAPERLREEELRLFYVALTRAKRELIVCGKRRSSADGDEFGGAARRAAAMNAGCELDFTKGLAGRGFDYGALSTRENAEAAQAEQAPCPVDAELVEAVRTRCAFEYRQSALPIKTCVTAIAESDGGDDYLFAAPVLTADERYDGGDSAKRRGKRGGAISAEEARLRGTACHRAMELVDFAAPDLDKVAAACERFELVNGADILRAAETMRELTRTCEYVFKEKYFIVDVPCRDVYGEADGESVLVQGVIDLLGVCENGDAIIVDYKTTAPEKLLCDEYRTQLRLYAAAVERSTPYRVRRKYLYSFVTGELTEVD